MNSATYADLWRPTAKINAFIYDSLLIGVGSFFVALSAQIHFSFPLSPVPITGQTLAVLLLGSVLGSKRGTLCLAAYLIEGISGFPVFAGGASGVAYLLGPTGGYLLGFVPAAYIVGFLSERGWNRDVGRTLFSMLLANVCIYVFGLLWLSLFTGWDKVFILGFYPFIAGDILKLILAAALLPLGWKLLALD